MGCVPSSNKDIHQNTGNAGDNWLNRPQEGYHWEKNKANNSDSKTGERNTSATANERDGTGVEGYVAAESYGGTDGMGGGAAACGAGGCGGCGGCGA